MKMPFGKYKGKDVSELPNDYIGWLKTISLREPLKSEIDKLEYVEPRFPPDYFNRRYIGSEELDWVTSFNIWY